ncbi:MAG: hypothetical protein AVDCRST_MAG12-519 [uncultured Rubrobacteraceae bacterium]|uniref:Uncharacterized protein n=1 Tax=uncultured Rubrobacteraceae bacterium TaxID=349277 RepID=A0A6J4R9V9_9ACTN|nr:MAG: hypothetical protein AVDCRST_MAG12-519 [uncultured Rubrobacteraceae bacterium]
MKRAATFLAEGNEPATAPLLALGTDDTGLPRALARRNSASSRSTLVRQWE